MFRIQLVCSPRAGQDWVVGRGGRTGQCQNQGIANLDREIQEFKSTIKSEKKDVMCN